MLSVALLNIKNQDDKHQIHHYYYSFIIGDMMKLLRINKTGLLCLFLSLELENSVQKPCRVLNNRRALEVT